MRDSMILYIAYAEKFKRLTDAQFGRLIRMAMDYQQDGTVPDTEDLTVALAFDVIRHDIDYNNKKYAEVVEKRREAGRKGGQANATKSKQMLPNATFDKQSQANQAVYVYEYDNEHEYVYDNNNCPPLPPAFILPCKNDEEYIVTQGEYQDLVDLYPTLDVMSQLRMMKGWLTGNKHRAKLKGDMPRFIYGWLNENAKEKAAEPERKAENRLGVFGDYKQSSTDDEWDELTELSFKEVNR